MSKRRVEFIRDWLVENQDKFDRRVHVKIRRGSRRSRRLKISIDDVCPNIQIVLHENFFMFDIQAHYKNDHWDSLAHFEVDVTKSSGGQYYNGMLLPEYIKYYATESELLISEGCLPFVEWVNKNIVDGAELYFFRAGCVSEAEIITFNEGTLEYVQRVLERLEHFADSSWKGDVLTTQRKAPGKVFKVPLIKIKQK